MSIVDRWKRLQWQGRAAPDVIRCLNVCTGTGRSIWFRGLPERLAPAGADFCVNTGFWNDFLFETVVDSAQSVRDGIASSKFSEGVYPANHGGYCLGPWSTRLRLFELICDVGCSG